MITKQLREQATELIDFGNSKEKAQGQGMIHVLNELEKYYKGFNVYDEYFDSLSNEAKEEVNEEFKKLGIY